MVLKRHRVTFSPREPARNATEFPKNDQPRNKSHKQMGLSSYAGNHLRASSFFLLYFFCFVLFYFIIFSFFGVRIFCAKPMSELKLARKCELQKKRIKQWLNFEGTDRTRPKCNAQTNMDINPWMGGGKRRWPSLRYFFFWKLGWTQF